MTTKLQRARKRTAKGRSLKRIVRQIADELLSVNYGTSCQMMGNRLAVMQGQYPKEKNLGGRCREVVEKVIMRHLSNI